MIRWFLIVTLFLAASLGVFGRIVSGRLLGGSPESPPTHVHAAAPGGQEAVPPEMTDGAEHPELIPDAVAYRLFFITVAEATEATDEQKARQRAYLATAGLEDQDIQSAVEVLATFKAQYDDLVKRYNESVDAANRIGATPELATFLARQDALVESTRDSLKAVLSPEGVSRFDAHLQREKRHMKVVKEAQ